ncbi:MAG TPA: S9 family peptidase [Thermoanaerobaculia bacterium]|nr:S9 family peptidase [Thermoanaerobaculia bacterium]
MKLSRIAIAGTFGFLFVLSAGAVPKSARMEMSHLAQVRRIESVDYAPDGKLLVYAVSRVDAEADRMVTEIKTVRPMGGGLATLAEGRSPRFSPDGSKVAYLAKKGEASALHLYDLATGKSEELVAFEGSDHFMGHEADFSFAWAPDGKSIAYLAVEPRAAEPAQPESRGTEPAETASTATEPSPEKPDSKEPRPEEPRPDPVVISRILYKTRTGFSPNRPLHVWVVVTQGAEKGKARLLTPGPWDEHSLAWTPDSRRIVFVSNRSAEPDANYSDDLWVVEVATGTVARLTQTPGPEMHPAVSPDGEWLAFLAMSRAVNTKDSPAEDQQLWVQAFAGGPPQKLSAAVDRRVNRFLWEPSSQSLLLTVDDQGRTPLLRLTVPSPKAAGPVPPQPKLERVHEGYFTIGDLALDPRGRFLAYVRSASAQPPEVFLTQLGAGRTHQVSQEHKDLVASVRFAEADSYTATARDGVKLQGFVMKPPGVRPGVRYPAVLWIHGGPHGMHSHAFSERTQILAALGWGVILPNPRGSTGYGQAFADGTLSDWGGGDYQDLMAALDGAIAQHDWIDPGRLAVAGGSYGGYMTNWVVTQTDRFKAAVSWAGLSNLISFYGTSIYPDLIEAEYGERPWQRWDALWQDSPLAHVAKLKTPLLLVHGENDNDVPIVQAEEMFLAAKKLGVPTELVRYPGEGHGINRPSFRRDFYQRTLAWLERHLGPAPPQGAPEEAAPKPPASGTAQLPVEPPER